MCDTVGIAGKKMEYKKKREKTMILMILMSISLV